MSKMLDVQFGNMTTDFELFSSLSKGKIYFFLLFTSNLSYFNSFKLPYRIRLLAFRSPLTARHGSNIHNVSAVRMNFRSVAAVVSCYCFTIVAAVIVVGLAGVSITLVVRCNRQLGLLKGL